MNGPLTAYVLHFRAYKETSALVDLFTPQGRLRGVARGARRKSGALVRPFLPLEVELKGRGELKTIVCLESLGAPLLLTGDALYSGFYLNELLIRLLPLEDAHPQIYTHYVQTLGCLAADGAIQPLLRTFEWHLLDQLGYGFALDVDGQGKAIDSQRYYRFVPEEGLQPSSNTSDTFAGHLILAMAAADWVQPATLKAAKHLMRQALAPHLGNRPLVSRTLFLKPLSTGE